MESMKWLGLLAGLLIAAILNVDADDVVYSPENSYGPTFTVPYQASMETTVGYHDQDGIVEDARLNCFDCTSYMPECKRIVSDREGLIVSRAGCKSKCFLRVGEEKNGALYRGCMDDFVSAKLVTDYVGCKVQEWNGRKTLWCLCDDDLCNGESIKSLFYYGYGKGAATVAFEEPAETALLEPMSSVDAEFDKMTDSLDNYNSLYAIEPKTLEKDQMVGIENLVHEEPVMVTTAMPDYMEPIDSEDMTVQSNQMETLQFREDFHQPDPHYFPPEQIRYVSPQGPSYPTEEYPPAAPTDHYPIQPQNSFTHEPNNGGQYPPPIPPYHDVPVPFFLPNPGFHPYNYMSQYPPLNTYLKHPDHFGPPPPPMSFTKREDPMDMPEGKSFSPFDKFGPIPHQDYQYNYHEGPAEFELEPVSYFPYEENQHQPQREERPLELNEDLKAPVEKESVPTQEEAPKDLDTDLFCPSAGIFTYEEDCSKFVMCLIDHLKGRPRMYIMKCPGGLVFDSLANTCMKPEMSDGCKRLPIEETHGEDIQMTTEQPPNIDNMAPQENDEIMGGIYQGQHFEY